PTQSSLFPYTTLFRSKPPWLSIKQRLKARSQRRHKSFQSCRCPDDRSRIDGVYDATIGQGGTHLFKHIGYVGGDECRLVRWSHQDRKSTHLNSSHVAI